jgi:orotidine-5'-phosphate decarboxylase
MPKDVIIACDFASEAQTFAFLEKLGSERPFLKIGMELYYAAGPNIVRKLKDKGYKIFLDLKLHDIPNTVEKAMRVIADLGADMINVHAAGTVAMMEAAMRGVSAKGNARPLVIAVTQLTSTDEARMQNELLIGKSLPETVLHYAQNAQKAGLDGVVCSPLESESIHNALGSGFLTVTPGVRFTDGEKSDQVRVATPAKARKLGSDYIVVGRPITEAADPAEAYARAVADFLGR